MVDIFLFKKILVANELGGDRSLAYKFSDAGGKSGWSFGVSQFDVSHNHMAVQCLIACKYTQAELKDILVGNGDMVILSRKLLLHTDIIDSFDNNNLQKCLDIVMDMVHINKIKYENKEVLYHLADSHNQFFISLNGKMSKYLQNLGKIVVSQDILDLKLTTKWGKERPDDVYRRYNNIQKIINEE